jgi:hypothetical protein
VDLVGDLASYRPGGKVVIFEGGGDSDFDQKVAATLFPELQREANLISGSNKIRVHALHETLERAAQRGHLPFEFFSITDRDSDGELAKGSSVNRFVWDVYHIENYLLAPKYIQSVLLSLEVDNWSDEDALWDELRICATETIPHLVRHQLSEIANRALISAIDLGTDPKAADAVLSLRHAVERSSNRVLAQVQELTEEYLRTERQRLEQKYIASLADGTWVSVVRGRDVLKRFAGKHCAKVSYEVFRTLLVSAMRNDGHRPPGMNKVISQIIPAKLAPTNQQ